MSRFLLTAFILITTCSSGFAQRAKPAVPALPRPDTTYFDHDWERTQLPEDRVYARIARHDAQGKTVGTVRDYFYPSWKKQWEGKLAGEAPDKPQGLCTGWFENGSRQFTGTYTNGQAGPDYRSWAEDGHEIRCQVAYQDALAFSQAKLHSYFNDGSSRQVFPVDVPAGTEGIVYKLDIRDEGQPPISWSNALALSTVVLDPTATTAATLMAASRALSQQQGPAASVSTKCHWFIVADAAAAQQFVATKGQLPSSVPCLRRVVNVTQETRELVLPAGMRRLYICVNNDNNTTAATAAVSVSALVRTCK